MKSDRNAPLIKPSDAKAWSLCARRVWLDHNGDFELSPSANAFEQLIIELGVAHEQSVLHRLSRTMTVHTATSLEDTRQLIAEGAPVIYQAQLLDEVNGFIGYPDFLIRHETGEYQPADAKLSLSAQKREIQIQLGLYRRMLANKLPAIVFLGDGEHAQIGDEANAITDQFVTEMRELLTSDQEPSVRYSQSKCRVCLYYTYCKPAFEAKEELSLLYGIQGRTAMELENENITSITQLAATDPNRIPDIAFLKGKEKKKRAVLQAKAYMTGHVFQLSPVSLPNGHWVHFDIEDNPLTMNGERHVYLWGFLLPDYSRDSFEYVWTDHDAEDEQGWLQFLAQIEQYRRRYPELILAHYSNHERTTIRAYATRYGMEDNATVNYLLGDESPLFDMQKPVLDNLVLPLQGYGLKDICKHKNLVNFQWEDKDSGSQWSIVQFHRFLAETNQRNRENLKSEILGYNRDDVMATRRLEEWLRTNFIA